MLSRLRLLSLLILLLYGGALAVFADAPKSGNTVGNVIAIDGNLSVMRADQPRWSAGYLQMDDFVKDHLKTDDASLAALELKVGGRIGINKGTEILITEGGDAKDVSGASGMQTVVLQSGTMWAKFKKQEAPLRIKTSTATMTIKGTEFVVESGAGGGTTVSVLEGAVAVTPAKEGAPTEIAKEGMQVTIKSALEAPVVKQYEKDQLRRDLNRTYGALFHFGINYIGGFSEVAYWSSMAVDVINDPEQAARDYAASQVSGYDPTGVLSHVIRNKPKKDPPFPIGMSPNQESANPDALTFSWTYNGADTFLLLMSRDEKMQTLDWTAKVKGTSVSYPRNGLPLSAGQKYFWRVVALNDQDKPKGKASQSYFTVPASYHPK